MQPGTTYADVRARMEKSILRAQGQKVATRGEVTPYRAHKGEVRLEEPVEIVEHTVLTLPPVARPIMAADMPWRRRAMHLPRDTGLRNVVRRA